MNDLIYLFCGAIGLVIFVFYTVYDYQCELCHPMIGLSVFIAHACVITVPIFESHAGLYTPDTYRILSAAFMHLCIASIMATRFISIPVLLERQRLMKDNGTLKLKTPQTSRSVEFDLGVNLVTLAVTVVVYMALADAVLKN